MNDGNEENQCGNVGNQGGKAGNEGNLVENFRIEVEMMNKKCGEG